jgi:hypothetical protein
MPSRTGRYSRIDSFSDQGRGTRTPVPVPDPGSGIDVAITVTSTTLVASTLMEPSISWVSSNPVSFDRPGWPNTMTNGRPMFSAQSTHIFPFGLGDPWGPVGGTSYTSVPSNPAPTSELDFGTTAQSWFLNGALTDMTNFSSTGPKHMKVYGGCWWMKHTVGVGNVITDLTPADHDSPNGRMKYSRMPDWLYMVRTAAKIAMTYGVRWFSIWNELKGYLDTGTADMSMNSGAPVGGIDQPMGYCYFYKKTSEEILLAQADLKALYDSTGGAQGVNVLNSDIKIGGPYCTIRGRSTTAGAVSASNPYASLLYARPWGYMAQATYTPLETFLTNVAAQSLRFDFLSVDGADYNQGIATDGSAVPADWSAADDWDNGRRWYDWHSYFAATLTAHGLGTKAVVWDEYYRYPVKEIYQAGQTRDDHDAAITADFFRACLLGNVKWPFAWGPWPINFPGANASRVPELLSNATTSAGSQPTLYGGVAAMYKANFPPGTVIKVSNTSDDTKVLTLANTTDCVVINKTNGPLGVAVNGGTVHTMRPYEVAIYPY